MRRKWERPWPHRMRYGRGWWSIPATFSTDRRLGTMGRPRTSGRSKKRLRYMAWIRGGSVVEEEADRRRIGEVGYLK